MNQNIVNLDLVKIGNVTNVNFVESYFSVNFYYDINIDDLKFLFLDIYEEFIPFKILKFEEQNNKLNFTVKDIDLLKSFKTVKFKIYIEKDKFNDIIENEEDVNIINFEVFDKNNNYCGYVSNVFDYPGNKCLEICKHNVKKLLPFISKFVLDLDIKKSKITINNINDLT